MRGGRLVLGTSQSMSDLQENEMMQDVEGEGNSHGRMK